MGEAQIIQGNALDLPIGDGSVDLVCTSPPYFSLRSYADNGEHYDGQIGDEATSAEYLDNLIAATAEMVRVLKPSGSIWVNLGDKYNAYNGNRGDGTIQKNGPRQTVPAGSGLDVPNVRPKSLLGMPWRYAIRCMDELDLILRAEVIWSKPNGLPESVTDRVRRSHETWFHFTKEPRYFAAVDEIREPLLDQSQHAATRRSRTDARLAAAGAGQTSAANPLGKLPGSVWTIPTQPLTVPPELGIDHFAAFPPAIVRKIVLGWSPSGICTACGEGRRPVSEVADREPNDRLSVAARARTSTARGSHLGSTLGYMAETADRRIVGYACACTPRTSHRGKQGDWKEGREVMPDHRSDDFHSPGNAVPRRPGGFGTKVPPSLGEWEYHFDDWEPAPTTPAVVLDPFGGTGTTALVAKVLGRVGISVDMSADYGRLAEWRVNDPGQLAAAAELPKPAKVDVGQEALF